MKKNSKLLKPINKVLEYLKQHGKLDALENQWLEVIVETEIHDAS